MAGPVREAPGAKGGPVPFDCAIWYDSRHPRFLLGEYVKDRSLVEGDPFGLVLGDGRPVIWVWRTYDNLLTDTKIGAALELELPVETVYYAEDKWRDGGECNIVSELDLDRLKKSPFTAAFYLGRAIPVHNRTRSGVKKDCERLWDWCNSLP